MFKRKNKTTDAQKAKRASIAAQYEEMKKFGREEDYKLDKLKRRLANIEKREDKMLNGLAESLGH